MMKSSLNKMFEKFHTRVNIDLGPRATQKEIYLELPKSDPRISKYVFKEITYLFKEIFIIHGTQNKYKYQN